MGDCVGGVGTLRAMPAFPSLIRKHANFMSVLKDYLKGRLFKSLFQRLVALLGSSL